MPKSDLLIGMPIASPSVSWRLVEAQWVCWPRSSQDFVATHCPEIVAPVMFVNFTEVSNHRRIFKPTFLVSSDRIAVICDVWNDAMKVGGSNGSILSAPLLISTGWGNPGAKSHGAPHVGSRKDDAAHQVAGARQQAPHLAFGEGSKGRIVCIQLPFTTIVEYCSEIHTHIYNYIYIYVCCYYYCYYCCYVRGRRSAKL